MRQRRSILGYALLLLVVLLLPDDALSRDHKKKSTGKGLAAKKKGDAGLKKHKDVLLFEDFEGKSSPLANDPWVGKPRRTITKKKSHVFAGKGALESQNKKGSHAPHDTYAKLTARRRIRSICVFILALKRGMISAAA